ncbi:CRISPR-associated helicase Cas3 (plasmid) [Bosea sp. RAC05]|nr:CRISPR-associated helicase Cas3 [Bosea sp. RAC05]
MARKALQAIGFDPSSSRVSLASRPLAFSAVSEHPPRDVQTATGSFEGNVVVLESETGSGKTEAALWRFARLFEAGEVDGLYFALPTRVAATSLHERVSKAVETLFPDPAYRPAVTMAVPGMVAPTNDQQTGTELCGSPDLTESPADMRSASMWASEGPKRYLAGTIAVGTIDQVLLASLNAKHAHLRLSALARLLLVVDEVHASDAYMASLLGNLLAFHRRAGGHALLLSATLGSNARDSLLGTPRRSVPFEQAVAAPYPALSSNACPDPLAQPGNGRDRTIAIQLDTRIGDPAAVAGIAIKAAGLGAKVLVIRNLRRDAIKVLEECKLAGAQDLLFKCGGVATLHHGRFAREDRRALDRAVEGAIGLKRPAGGTIVIGTQTLEQSLDIDADLLISDICPADVLLQRLGRLHRHDRGRRPAGFEAPRAVVMAPNDLAGLYHRGEHGIGLFQSNGQSTPYPYSDVLAVEATRQAIVDYPSWEIPIMNRLLVELATHPEARASLLDRLDPSGGWEESDAIVTGRGAAYKLQAGYAHLPFDSAFDDQAVVMSDDPLSTRLGEKDLLVQFPERLPGPFGSPVSSIAIPHFWMRGLNGLDEPVPTEIRRSTDGFSFQFGSSRFVYDAMGVRPEK